MLTDAHAWANAGRSEFAFATQSVGREGGHTMFGIVVAGLAFSMVPLGIVMQFNPVGPEGTVAHVVHFVANSAGVALGAWWLVRPWPSLRGAIGFLVLSDIVIGVTLSMLSAPEARICGTIHLAMLGMYAAFLLGWRILLLHCAYTLLLIAAFTQQAILVEGRTQMDLFIYTAPAISTVVGLPLVIQVFVEMGRRAMTRIVDEWHMDDLTGVYNRRGMNLAVMRAISEASVPAVHVVGMIDMDGFKRFNDTRGHFAGDELLRNVARTLEGLGDDVLVARNGGDEFAVFAVRRTVSDAEHLVGDLRALIATREDRSVGLVASPGVVIADASANASFDELAATADTALYEAKGSSDTAVVVVGRAPAVGR
ncbi:GGDEF domain-containing protein [Tsukamurella paurometabola]|uniref:GGDEF domain-containing protein n=1 Tax=Tsukamurella paurometabola TaxID=2061 RepID=A0ABS5NCC7_TSUPA|nr:GGDEF domain-containing protein [Tsukamurella paurometabola]MBS4101934.1 GGDEF domain-containing protein [Tsukamurella paurometabola]